MIITVKFSFPEENSSDAIFSLHNFAEDLERELYKEQTGHVLNMDTATDEVLVMIKSKRYLGDVSKTIKTYLGKYKFLDKARLDKDKIR